jgi:hypothetical protein
VIAGPNRRRGRADRGGREVRGGRDIRGGPDLRDRVGARRTGAFLTPARAGGLLGLVLAGLVLRLATTSEAFALAQVDAPELRWTSREAIEAAVGVGLGTNVFAIETRPIEDRLRALPAVAAATVRVGIPTSLEVSLTERDPILAWRAADRVFLVDRDGRMFATVDPASLASMEVPIIADGRADSSLDLAVGRTLDAVDLDVATRLASLVPADIGSAATRLTVSIDDRDGFVVRGAGVAWRAVFGTYSVNVRPASMIPGQVQLLRSLVAGREATLDRIVLASTTDGTVTLRATPNP